MLKLLPTGQWLVLARHGPKRANDECGTNRKKKSTKIIKTKMNRKKRILGNEKKSLHTLFFYFFPFNENNNNNNKSHHTGIDNNNNSVCVQVNVKCDAVNATNLHLQMKWNATSILVLTHTHTLVCTQQCMTAERSCREQCRLKANAMTGCVYSRVL